jgi:hypothetical protein
MQHCQLSAAQSELLNVPERDTVLPYLILNWLTSSQTISIRFTLILSCNLDPTCRLVTFLRNIPAVLCQHFVFAISVCLKLSALTWAKYWTLTTPGEIRGKQLKVWHTCFEFGEASVSSICVGNIYLYWYHVTLGSGTLCIITYFCTLVPQILSRRNVEGG